MSLTNFLGYIDKHSILANEVDSKLVNKAINIHKQAVTDTNYNELNQKNIPINVCLYY